MMPPFESAIALGERGEALGSSFKLEYREYSLKERLARAGRSVGICLAGAFGAIFIPVLHFILVPGLILIGIVLGFARLDEKTAIVTQDVACPHCQKPVRLDHRFRIRWPIRQTCPECRQELRIGLATQN